MAPREYVVENDFWQACLLPETGASTGWGKVRIGDKTWDLLRPTAEHDRSRPSACSSFVLAPWSNRIRDGRFTWGGKIHELHPNAADGTAIHGVVRNYPWRVESAAREHVVMSFSSVEHAQINFPFRFSARMQMRLEGPRFITRLAVRNEDTVAMPAGFGHHPYFQRTLQSTRDEARLQIPCALSYDLEACMPSGPPIPIRSRIDFRSERALGTEPIDDCLTGRQGLLPARIEYPESGVSIAFGFDPIFTHVVVYVPPGKSFFAVEPVTQVNDGFNLHARGVADTGVFSLAPGEERAGTSWLEVAPNRRTG